MTVMVVISAWKGLGVHFPGTEGTVGGRAGARRLALRPLPRCRRPSTAHALRTRVLCFDARGAAEWV